MFDPCQPSASWARWRSGTRPGRSASGFMIWYACTRATAPVTRTESVAMWRTRGWLSYQAAALAFLGTALTEIDQVRVRAAFTEAREIFVRTGNPERVEEMDRCLSVPRSAGWRNRPGDHVRC